MSEHNETTQDQSEGLQSRYFVKRLNDTAGKHNECRFFVLDPQHDPIARHALAVYADDVAGTHPALSRDLWDWIEEVTP